MPLIAMEELGKQARLDDPKFYGGDPHPIYARLRREAPVYWYEPGGFWALSRYAELTAALTRPEVFSSAGALFINQIKHQEVLTGIELDDVETFRFGSDPPAHTTYRGLMRAYFAPRAVRAGAESVAAIVRDVVDRLPVGEVVNATEDLAVPVSIYVIADALGVPRSDWMQFRRWSDAMVDFVDGTPGTEEFNQALHLLGELRTYLSAQLEDRHSRLRDDMLSKIAVTELQGTPTSLEFQVNYALALLAAGNETTRNTIAAGAAALAEHPDEQRKLVGDPGLVGSATDEILRWTSVVPAFVRTIREPVEINGARLAVGDHVVLLYAAANRDESAWPDADVFNVARQGKPPHVAFGWGTHRCIGAHLAQLEIGTVFRELVTRFSGWELAGDVRRKASLTVDGYTEVPLVFTGRGKQN